MPCYSPFVPTANTKLLEQVLTYAQNLCYGPASYLNSSQLRYQTNSACKSLIYIETLKCFFSGQSKKNVDLRASSAHKTNLSTKLSTENLDIYKLTVNQGLSDVCGYFFEELRLCNLPKNVFSNIYEYFFGVKKHFFKLMKQTVKVKVSGTLKVAVRAAFRKSTPFIFQLTE